MSIANQLMSEENPLVQLLGDYKKNHVGFVFTMGFTEANVLTNDAWKHRVSGIPHNSFLVAASFHPEKMAQAHFSDLEVILLRVLGPAPLPTDSDLLRTRIEHNQRKIESEIFTKDIHDGLDPLTHSELQYGALRCRILGTFYLETGLLCLGSDLESYMNSAHMTVFKPEAEALSLIVNHINPEVIQKVKEEAIKSGFSNIPSPIEIGTVRYTSTDRLQRSSGSPVTVQIQPTDFLARRTAVLGMTRTGKSNTVKTTVAAVTMAAMKDKVIIGQIIFDLNGEYANANGQDDGSSISEVFSHTTIRYRGLPADGFLDMRNNFFQALQEGLEILQAELTRNGQNNSQDMQTLTSLSLAQPQKDAFETDGDYRSAEKRWLKTVAIYRALLFKSGLQPDSKDKTITFPAGNKVLTDFFDALFSGEQEIFSDYASSESKKVAYIKSKYGDSSKGMSLEQTVLFFERCREANLISPILTSSGNHWFSDQDKGLLNLLVGRSENNTPIRSTRVIGNAVRPFHSPTGTDDIPRDIYKHLKAGKIVIVDLSVGVESVRKTSADRIASYILRKNMEAFTSGKEIPNMVIYVEEAHNIIGRDANFDTTWPRIAKEGAKAGLALVYSTQEPSSVHPNILANTENWFVTHLNNENELRSLGKFYDFGDFHESLKSAQNVGFARIKTLSSPFVIPTQIRRFTPQKLKKQLSEMN